MDQRVKFTMYHRLTEKKLIQKVLGKFLYYVQEVYPILLAALRSTTTDFKKNNTNGGFSATFKNYCATKPNKKLLYQDIDMILRI